MKLKMTAALAVCTLGASACTLGTNKGAQQTSNPATATGTGSTTSGGGTAAGGGVAGATTSSTVANANNIYFRIQNALTLPQPNATATPNAPLVSYLSKNFKTAAAQQSSNLSTTSNPLTASGVGSVPLLAFAACSDVSPGSYGVTGTLTSAPTTTQSTAILNSGVTIVNQCTAGLAASGTTLNTQVTAIFNTQLAGNPSGTTATQAFVGVCTAATTFCVSMTGY